jgi:hypothetical protein
MSNKSILVAALAMITIPGTVVAGPMYNYVEGGFVRHDLDGGPNLNGGAIAGSFAITDNFHVMGEFSSASNSGVSLDLFTVALGYNHSISDTTDFVARAGWVTGRAKVNPLPSVSDDGWMAQIGLRSQMTSRFEFNGFITTIEGDDTSLDFGAVYNFTDALGATGIIRFGDDVTTLGLGLRFSF